MNQKQIAPVQLPVKDMANAVNVLLITARAEKCLDAFFPKQVRKHMIDQLKTCIETDKITTKCFEQLSVNHYK